MDINTRDEILQTLVHRVDTLERIIAQLDNRIEYLTTFVRDYCINPEVKEKEK